MADSSEGAIDHSTVGYDKDCPPCRHCGAHDTHWTEYHGDYDCHCECCGRVYMSRERLYEVDP